MKKKILGSIAILAITAVAAFNVNLNVKSNDLSDISLANVEAQANWITEWYNSEVYRCEEDACSFTFLFWTNYGKYEKCKEGTDYAHCSSCSDCDAW